MARKLIGLTGGIASGKSAVANRLAELGAEIIDTDLISREVVEPGTPALAQIAVHFGPEVIAEDGTLNRAVVREKVFANLSERKWLEALLHPVIRQTALDRAQRSQAQLAVLVVPLLFESGQYQHTDLNLVVDVPVDVQRQRVLARDVVSEDQVEQILGAQMSRGARLEKADRVIENSGTLEQLFAQVDALYAELVAES
jgi:dephospho-CoA kinase